MQTKIVLIGAGSLQFGYDSLGDIFQSEVLRGSHIVLHDINEEALSVVHKNGKQFLEEHNLDFTLSATIDRKEALQDAGFIVISIEVGDRFALWDQDWRIPLQFGLHQVFGENGGPGGFFHALRVIPPIIEICEDIQKICPDAFIFNYSNPMSRICTTVHKKFPDLKFIGLCHEIKSLSDHLPMVLGTPMENIQFRAGGLNHFSVLLEATYRDSGKDAYPDILEKAPAYFRDMTSLGEIFKQLKAHEAGSTPGSEPALRSKSGYWPERLIFKIFLEKYKLLPITTDSHLGEYPAWAHDAADHKGIYDFWMFYQDWLTKDPEIKLELAERLVPIIEGIITDSGYEESAVNLPNKGYIDRLPEFLVVEVPAVIDKNGATGIKLENLPMGYVALLQNQVAIHEMTAETVLSGSRDVAMQALLADPTVNKVEAAEKMLDTMIDLQEDFLGYLK